MSADQSVRSERARLSEEIDDIAQLENVVKPEPDPSEASRWHLIYWIREGRSAALKLDTDRHPDLLARFLVETGWGRAVGATSSDAPGLQTIFMDAHAEGLTTFDETRRAAIADRILQSDWFRGIEYRNA